MYLNQFICILIGVVLTSIFYHLYYYNGKILFDKADPDKSAFKLCILKVDKLRRRHYVIFKIDKQHYIRKNNIDFYGED